MKIVLSVLLVWAAAFGQVDIRGFSAAQAQEHRDREAKALAIPQPERMRTYMERMSAEPHLAGSPASKAVAEYIAGLFREWGLAVQIEQFEALLPYPKSRSLQMTAPTRFTAKLAEPKIQQDRDSGDKGQVATYNAYSGNGDVSGQVVYVNYGIPEDYEQLKKLGHRRQGQNRARPLWQELAGHQSKGRAGERGGRLPYLLRPARRRIFSGRRLSEGRFPSA